MALGLGPGHVAQVDRAAGAQPRRRASGLRCPGSRRAVSSHISGIVTIVRRRARTARRPRRTAARARVVAPACTPRPRRRCWSTARRRAARRARRRASSAGARAGTAPSAVDRADAATASPSARTCHGIAADLAVVRRARAPRYVHGSLVFGNSSCQPPRVASRGTRGRRLPSRGGAPAARGPTARGTARRRRSRRSTSACTSAPVSGSTVSDRCVARDARPRASRRRRARVIIRSGIVSRMNQFAVSPQSTVRLMPVMPEASSEARNAKPAAISRRLHQAAHRHPREVAVQVLHQLRADRRLGHRRVGEAGRDAVRADAVRRQLDRHRPVQPEQARPWRRCRPRTARRRPTRRWRRCGGSRRRRCPSSTAPPPATSGTARSGWSRRRRASASGRCRGTACRRRCRRC